MVTFKEYYAKKHNLALGDWGNGERPDVVLERIADTIASYVDDSMNLSDEIMILKDRLSAVEKK